MLKSEFGLVKEVDFKAVFSGKHDNSVLGPSGCGKTTLLNIVAGFLAPTKGKVILNKEEVHGPASDRGMVFQQGALFEWMGVSKNIPFKKKSPDKPGLCIASH